VGEAKLMRLEDIQGDCWQTLTRIDPSLPKVSRLADLWTDRYLLWILTLRDIKVRYKQTLLGAAWAVLQPLLTMLVFTFVFSRVAKVSSGQDPYPLFVLCGLLPWQCFSYGLIRSSNSLVESRYLLTKVSLPRLVFPFSAVLSGVPDFVVALTILISVMVYYRIWPPLSGLLVIPLIAATVFLSLSIGLFLSAVNVRYRDVGYVIPFFTQLLFFVTPVAYPLSLVPRQWQLVYSLNPMVALVETFRYVILGKTEGDWHVMVVAAGSVVLLFVASLTYFQRVERNFADVV
jgi:lipopolysaccharide transport system permease protein